MGKIGIISFYYKNHNYGGILQAYALTRFINGITGEKSCLAEQVCYNAKAISIPITDRIVRFICRGNILDKYRRTIPDKEYNKKADIPIKDNFEMFSLTYIPHSEAVYDDSNYLAASKEYDLFVVGSDQVWNPLAVRDFYLLKGINKPKISYAASIASGGLKLLEKIKYKLPLEQFDRISVREKSSIDVLNSFIKKKIELSVDPVFLLNRRQWIDLIQKKKNDKGTYIFAYFLSPPDEHMRKIIKEYAKDNQYRIIGIEGTYTADYFDGIRECDPLDFLNYIYNAKIVMTDSFHATAFSVIFHVPFLVSFRQSKKVDMSERIVDFLEAVEMPDRLLSDRMNISISPENYCFDKADIKLEEMIIKSKEYLVESISNYIT